MFLFGSGEMILVFEYRNSFKCRQIVPASRSSGNAFVPVAGCRKFKSRAGQIGRNVANGSQLLQYIFEKSELCCPGAMTRRCAPRTRYTPRRNTTSELKDLIL